MAIRSNALSEMTRFWLQARHGCVVSEAVPVKVPYNYSDIDFLALRPDLTPWTLPDGTPITRAIIETKDEHDFDPKGKDFGRRLKEDVQALSDALYISKPKLAHFSLLRQEHYELATRIFGTADFDRLFIVHALDPDVRNEICPILAKTKRIYWLTVHEIVTDLFQWYQRVSNRAGLRHSLMGDLWHLLIGYCGFRPSE